VRIDSLREQWEAFGRADPLWANLTAAGRDHGGWDVQEFLATGREEVERYLAALEELGMDVPRGRALDFGCGAGRLTQALGEHFEQVDGVDIATSMIEHARRLNRYGDRCRYHVNDAPNLSLFEPASFDLVVSVIVLQHMEPRYALGYIREFVRVLRPGGVALFQIPAADVARALEPLPEAAWRAELAVEEPPDRLRAGEPVELRVRIRNASPVAWPADAGLGVGAHWRTEAGTLVKIGDGRTPLPHELAPGAEVTLPLVVRPPNAPARRVLEVDAVQEGVAWFRERGSDPVRLPAEIVGEGADDSPREEPGFEPWMEMHVVSRDEVAAFVEAAGGEVAHALADQSAGDAYESYLYVVRRSGTAGARPALRRLAAAIGAVPDRDDVLPPVERWRSGAVGELEVRTKRRIAEATRWFTKTQVAHDREVARALAEIEAVLLVQEAELRALRAELERRGGGSSQDPPAT
jgi:SAM-dependent methyltransferase